MDQRPSGLESSPADQRLAIKDVIGTRRVFEPIRKCAPFTQAMVLSTLPRGGLKLLQPANIPEGVVRAYDRVVHRHDRLAWTGMLRGTVVRGSDCWKEEISPFHSGFLRPLGMAHALAVPLSGPLLAGFPGALILLRGASEGNFSDHEVAELRNAGPVVDEYLVHARPERELELQRGTDPWTHTAAVRLFVINHEGVFPKPDGLLPPRVEAALREQASKRWLLAKRGRTCDGWVALADGQGENWRFGFHDVAEFPAIGQGPVLFASLQPQAFEWLHLQPWEVAADEELARMLRAMKFMQQEFAKGPSLDDIAAKANLSRFHFHRRFADLVGQTPKQFLVSCQIHEVKRQLVARRLEMSQISGQCGFSHQSHLASRFRQETGLTPTRWRRMALEMLQGRREDGSRKDGHKCIALDRSVISTPSP